MPELYSTDGDFFNNFTACHHIQDILGIWKKLFTAVEYSHFMSSISRLKISKFKFRIACILNAREWISISYFLQLYKPLTVNESSFFRIHILPTQNPCTRFLVSPIVQEFRARRICIRKTWILLAV